MPEEKTIPQQVRENQIANERATYQRDQKRAEERRLAEEKAKQEYEQYLKDVETYEKEKLEYEQELAQYESDLAQYEKEKAQYESDLAIYEAEMEAIRLKEKDIADKRTAIEVKYNTQIEFLIEEHKQKKTQLHYDFWKPGGLHSQGYSRSYLNSMYSKLWNPYESSIKKLEFERNTQLNYYEYSIAYPGKPLEGSIARTFNKSLGQMSLVNLQQKRDEARAMKLEYERWGAQIEAKSQRAKVQEKYDFIVKEYQEKKDKAPTFSPKVFKQAPKQATKQKPGIKLSEGFLTKPPVAPSSIIGTSQEESQKAVITYETTQKQQKELFDKLTKAKTSAEAIRIKEEYQKLNPYVGTPQTFMRKGEVIGQQGVLIEKKLESSRQEFESYQAIKDPKDKLTEIELIKPTVQTIVLPGQITYTVTNKPGEIMIPDEKGNLRKPTVTEAWKILDYFGKQTPKEFSMNDKLFNQYIQENLQDVILAEKKYDYKGLEDPLSQYPFEKAILEHGTELKVTGEKILFPEKDVSYTPTLEAVAFTELVENLKFKTGLTKEAPKQETSKYISKKLETPEGQQVLAGTIIGSVVIALAPVAGSIKWGERIAKHGTKEVLKIAEKIYVQKSDTAFKIQRLKEQFPTISNREIKYLLTKEAQDPQSVKLAKKLKEKFPSLPQQNIDDIVAKTQKADAIKEYKTQVMLKKELAKRFPNMPTKQIEQKVASMTAKEKPNIPYTVEKISNRSYLISAGRESNPANTPFIVVNLNQGRRFGKQTATATIYETATDLKTPRDIIIHGVQKTAGSELAKGRALQKGKIYQYPASGSNIAKVDPTQGQKSGVAIVGTSKQVLTKDLSKYPKTVIESVKEDTRKTAIFETKHETGTKAIEKDIKNLPEPGSKIPKELTKKATGKSDISWPGSKPGTSNIDLPKSPGQTTTKTDYIKERTEKLKEIARDIEKAKPPQNIKVFSSENMASATGLTSGLRTGATTKQAPLLSTATAQAPIQIQTVDPKHDIQSKMGTLTVEIQKKEEVIEQKIIERNVIKEKIKTNLDTMLVPRFSLITLPGLEQAEQPGFKFDIIELQEIIPKYPPGTPTPPETKIPTIPLIPIFTEKRKKEEVKLAGKKPSVVYFSWNVDLERPGRYLPGADLRVSKNPKIFKQTAKIQKMTMKKDYAEKRDRAVTNRLDKSLVKKWNVKKPSSNFVKKFKVKF